MIEWITLSRDQQRAKSLEQSLAWVHAGQIEWRLSVIDGSRYDLFSGFNQGARQTQGEILAFVHDDVQFLANGLALAHALEELRSPDRGFIGVAGSTLLHADGTWWGNGQDVTEVSRHCRGMFGQVRPGGLVWQIWPHQAALFGQVVVCDGVLLICHRSTLERLGGFDEQIFSGFHFYDVDITLRAHLAGLHNLVLPIPLVHFGQSKYDQAWEANRLKFVQKHALALPVGLGGQSR